MINLLPESEKRILGNKEKEKIALILEILVFFFFVCLILILFSIKFYVEGQLETAKLTLEQEKQAFEISEVKDLPDKIKSTNSLLSNLNSFYESQKSLSQILQEVSRTIPQGIYLTTFSYKERDSQITLSGFAKTREALFEFKNNLEAKGNFEGISFPPSAWIEHFDIDFNLNFKIKTEE